MIVNYSNLKLHKTHASCVVCANHRGDDSPKFPILAFISYSTNVQNVYFVK